MTDVVTAVNAAMSATRPEDIVEGVKTAVADEITRLDPTIKIKSTRYFNHTYGPDLIATWPDKTERPIFLRGSLGAVADSQDVEALADREPVLIGLVEERPAEITRLRQRLPETTRSLATEVSSVQLISRSPQSGERESQLGDLVRANLVRGGRGLLTREDAARISEVEAGEPAEALAAFQETVRTLFVGSTAERLNRTAGLLTLFFEENPSEEVLRHLEESPLTDGELRVVVPYLLGRASQVRSDRVWSAVGSTLSLPQLESMALELAGLDLTPLVRSAMGSLVGVKGAVFVNPDEISDEEKLERPAKWRMRQTRLSADIGPWAFFVVSDGRKLPDRDSASNARWDELSGMLREFDLVSIQLHGLSRRLQVANEDASTVMEDVQSIRESIDDDFHIPEVAVRAKGDPEADAVVVDFGASTVVGHAQVGFILNAARLLARRRPFAPEQLQQLGLVLSD